ncbi:MAG: UDP-N-acetylmuramoyl-L-alanine--D-glutamate ligase [Candidatus Levyibacteriota bacterium]|nr:MAG: UDP-N-acetylmuramoyl-L-alanine--D-glutamate ligase [Candidatus Levybacteria bacterium]
MYDFKDKKIAVLGMGIEGESSAEFLRKRGANVAELDQKIDKDYLEYLEKFDMIVRSPGIKRNLPQLIEAEKKGVIITSQTKLFFDMCPCPIIGVTGTKGKGTTSALIYEMLKESGKDVYLGGNIGNPPFTFLDKLTIQSKVVLEMSSFQLQDMTVSPHIGVVLMITQEHLAPDKKDSPDQNFHTDIYEYIDAKRNIIRFQSNKDFAVINRDYIASNESDITTAGKVFHVSREQGVSQGAYVKNNVVFLRFNDKEQKIIDAKDVLLRGGHNLENVCAVVMAATLSGVTAKNIVSVLTSFRGLEHRLQFIGQVSGVEYYDDSFSTTPETAIAAIQAFTEPEVLILGGAHKGSDFTELGRVISEAKNIKAIIGIGIEWSRIKSTIRYTLNAMRYIEGCGDMQEIVRKAAEVAKPGDVVVLSPACSSFDMFKNYKDRGEQFKREVGKLELYTP